MNCVFKGENNMKTTAKVKHRDYVPWGWIAIEFCDVKFFGERAKELEEKWREIEFSKYRMQRPIVDECELKKSVLQEEIEELRKKLKVSKKWYRPWYTKEEKQFISSINKKTNDIVTLDGEIAVAKDNMFYDASVLRRKAEKFLERNGFVLTSSTAAGNECVTYTDIWSD